MFWNSVVGAVVGGVIGGGVDLASQLIANGGDITKVNVSQLAGATAGGAVTGALVANGVPLSAANGVGAAAGNLVEQGVGNLTGERSGFSAGEVVAEGLVGVAVGKLGDIPVGKAGKLGDIKVGLNANKPGTPGMSYRGVMKRAEFGNAIPGAATIRNGITSGIVGGALQNGVTLANELAGDKIKAAGAEIDYQVGTAVCEQVGTQCPQGR
jgi:hypothetical protein